jgi:peptide-methionine (S)-S-oxide reductase
MASPFSSFRIPHGRRRIKQYMETATLAGGCFWCLEAVYKELRGVESVVSGYMGGHVERPTYQGVCGGDTGHAEVIQLVFDPSIIRYRDILEVFFSTHDPTTLNRQGNDVGTQYRSAIFWHNDEQRSAAAALIEELAHSGKYRNPIVTELAPASTFWPAEDYHQNYLRSHPNEPYCAYVVQPKLDKFRAHFPSLRNPS